MKGQGRREKRSRKIRRKIVGIFWTVIFVLLMLKIFETIFEKTDNPFCLSSENEKTSWEVVSIGAEETSQKKEELEEILRNETAYPQSMREALLKNPELLEFVREYPNVSHGVNGGLTKEEQEERFPLFLQWDLRWGYVPYGEENIGLCGCAPTCLSMVIFSITRNAQVTPDVIADFAVRGNYYAYGSGTRWALLKDAAKAYGMSAAELSLDENVMKNHLDNGEMIICSMRAGDFTDGGHFIVIYGYDGEGFLINDPNSRVRSAKKWPYERICGQIKNLWGYQGAG